MQPGIVRGPRGVQMDEVWAAADAVLALGERPTIERVRQHLGRGSPNTVGPMLDGWYGALAKRLLAPAEAVEQDTGADAPLPAPVIRAAKALWGRALQHADERTTAQFTRARQDLNAQTEELRQAQEALAQETQRLADRSEAYGVAMQAKDAQIAELGRLGQDLQQQLASNQEMLAAARLESTQLRLAADADRRRQEAKEVEHQAERTRLESVLRPRNVGSMQKWIGRARNQNGWRFNWRATTGNPPSPCPTRRTEPGDWKRKWAPCRRTKQA